MARYPTGFGKSTDRPLLAECRPLFPAACGSGAARL